MPTYQTSSRPWDLNSIIKTVIPSSQQCSKKRNFFDAPNSNFPLLNWLDIIVHRIESICKDSCLCPDYIFLSLKIDMSNFYIGLHTNSAESYLEIKLFFSHCYVRKSWTLIFFQHFWWSPFNLDCYCVVQWVTWLTQPLCGTGYRKSSPQILRVTHFYDLLI